MYTCNYIITIFVFIFYYMNTIDDMQNEMDFYGHCKKFVYIQDYVKFLLKIVYDTSALQN